MYIGKVALLGTGTQVSGCTGGDPATRGKRGVKDWGHSRADVATNIRTKEIFSRVSEIEFSRVGTFMYTCTYTVVPL